MVPNYLCLFKQNRIWVMQKGEIGTSVGFFSWHIGIMLSLCESGWLKCWKTDTCCCNWLKHTYRDITVIFPVLMYSWQICIECVLWILALVINCIDSLVSSVWYAWTYAALFFLSSQYWQGDVVPLIIHPGHSYLCWPISTL